MLDFMNVFVYMCVSNFGISYICLQHWERRSQRMADLFSAFFCSPRHFLISQLTFSPLFEIIGTISLCCSFAITTCVFNHPVEGRCFTVIYNTDKPLVNLQMEANNGRWYMNYLKCLHKWLKICSKLNLSYRCHTQRITPSSDVYMKTCCSTHCKYKNSVKFMSILLLTRLLKSPTGSSCQNLSHDLWQYLSHYFGIKNNFKPRFNASV